MKGAGINLLIRRPCLWLPGATLVMLVVLHVLPMAANAADIPNDYNFGPGPLTIRPQSPGQSLRMTTAAIVPGTIKPGFSVFTGISEASIWSEDSLESLDFAILDYRLGGTYGLNERLGFGLFFDKRHYFGGHLDQITLTTHDLFSIDQNGRDLVDKYRHVITRRDSAGNVIFETTDLEQFDHSGISFGGHYVLTFGSDGFLPAIGVTGIVRYATEAPPGDEDHPVDWSVGSGFSKRLSDTWYLYGYLSYSSYGQDVILPVGSTVTPLDYADEAINMILAGAWKFDPKWALLIQYLYSEGAMEDFEEMSEPSNEIDLGVKWQVGDNDVLEFTMIENFITMDNSADFGLYFAYAHHFGD